MVQNRLKGPVEKSLWVCHYELLYYTYTDPFLIWVILISAVINEAQKRRCCVPVLTSACLFFTCPHISCLLCPRPVPPSPALVSSLSAARQVWAAEADAPGGEEEGGGEEERPGGGDERLQQEEGGSRDALLISAPQERQGQEKVSQSRLSVTRSPHPSFHSRKLLFPTLLLSLTNPVVFSFGAFKSWNDFLFVS